MSHEKRSALTETRGGQFGATMVEYALISALIAVVCIAAVAFLGQQASSQFSRVASAVTR